MPTSHQLDLFDGVPVPEQAPYTAWVRLQGQRRWVAAATGATEREAWAAVLRQTRPTSCDITVRAKGEVPK